MRRVVIAGCAGSGKTNLAVRLGQRLGLPVVHLDVLFWRPGWKEGDVAGFRNRVAEAIAGDAWISDGNYVRETFDLRLARADAVIILERSRWGCLWRVISRAIFDRERADLPEGCSERPHWDLFEDIWNVRKFYRARLEAALISLGGRLPVIRLRNDQEIDAFLMSQAASLASTIGPA
jgi:adenylate kinase family enzyme